MAPSSLGLLQLPDEILITIVGLLEFQTLHQLGLVSKYCNDLAEPFLYHTIKILAGRQATILSRSFLENEQRVTWVRNLLVSTKFGDDYGLSSLPPHIAQMHNLRNLRLETPDCNAKLAEERIGWVELQDRYERIFESASAVISVPSMRLLPNLESCTLHFVDGKSEIYSMTKYAMLFLHPRLKSLTMSCASTDFPHKLLLPFQDDTTLVKSTTLEHLHLEECDIFPETLAILLSFPRALKSLKVSEGVRYDGFSSRSSRIHGNVSPFEFTQTLKEHCLHSLEELSLSLGHFRHSSQNISLKENHLNLSMFASIKTLEVDLRTVNLLRTRPVCDHETWRRFPPNLENLKVFSIPLGQRMPFRALVRPYFPFDTCFVEDTAKHGVRHLKSLYYSYEFYSQDLESPMLSINDEGDTVEEVSQVTLAQNRLVEKCEEHRPKYKKAQVQLGIEMVALPNGFIPPYLHPEEKPRSYLFWTSHQI